MSVSPKRSLQASHSSTFVGKTVPSYVLSPVIEQHHLLWQWRTVLWRKRLHAVPFLLHWAPGVPAKQPFLHHTTAELILTSGQEVASAPAAANYRNSPHRFGELIVPSPAGGLHATISGQAGEVHPLTRWVDDLFDFPQQSAIPGEAVVNHEESISSTDSWRHVPSIYHNVVGCGLAELILAVDRLAALLARRHITLANACWAVLADSKADLKPFLRYSALDIEREVLVMAKAHEMINVSLGDAMRRPLLTIEDYPSMAGW
ncbi:hypothetical protein, conserved [Trypanosoma brucei brucei TREU927]|uniref:Uncharacterized protein n=1 Tax=Trypanosoma brucei brucei (strain 927/4 GUTat10.1) TaxID=185431 RepID=Q389D5_TRYB2|nr:hypothetical protein, conserved [Trypanosoma brucei brucei TREU927]EAN78585.1 hypothetical protein, conserved [Trypanosoma brucei brucei TREU927]